jgi:hypothetical protein
VRPQVGGHLSSPLQKISNIFKQNFWDTTPQAIAKPDLKIDARVAAHFAEALRPQQVVKMIGPEENRLEKTFIPAVRQDIQTHFTWRRQRLKGLNRDLDDQTSQSPLWQDQDRLGQSVPGIGPAVSRAVMAQLPEIGTLPGKKTVPLRGVANFSGHDCLAGAD